MFKNNNGMTFDDITGDGRLWAVRYEGATDNELFLLFEQWNDVVWLRKFFKENFDDLKSYFRITDINQAISETIDDSEILEGVIIDILGSWAENWRGHPFWVSSLVYLQMHTFLQSEHCSDYQHFTN